MKNKLQFLIVLSPVFCLIFLGMENTVALTIAITFILYLLFTRNGTPNNIKWLLIVGFSLRAIVAFIDQNLGLFPYRWDLYFPISKQIFENIKLGYPLLYGVNESINVLSYSIFTSLIFLLSGDYQLVIRIVNCFLGVLAIDRAYRVSIAVFDNKRLALLPALFITFSPSFVIFTSLDMRDAMIFFFFTDFIFRFYQMLELKKNAILLVLIDLIFLAILRIQNVFLITAIMLSYILIWGYLRINRKLKCLYCIASTSVVVIMFIYFKNIGLFDYLFRYISHDLITRSAGGSVYLAGRYYQSWADVLKWLPIRFLHFTFGPFLWSLNNSFMIIAFFESFILLIFFGGVILRWKDFNLKANSYLIFLLLTLALGLVGNAIVDSNYGTAIRHRMNYTFLLVMLGSPFISSFKVKF